MRRLSHLGALADINKQNSVLIIRRFRKTRHRRSSLRRCLVLRKHFIRMRSKGRRVGKKKTNERKDRSRSSHEYSVNLFHFACFVCKTAGENIARNIYYSCCLEMIRFCKYKDIYIGCFVICRTYFRNLTLKNNEKSLHKHIRLDYVSEL